MNTISGIELYHFSGCDGVMTAVRGDFIDLSSFYPR